jgi:hypothetical protein
MSLLERVKKGIKQRRAERKQEKQERKTIEKEAREAGKEEYRKAFREEKIKVAKAGARARAKRDSTGRGVGFNATKIAKTVAVGLSNAGKNLLESDQLNVGVPNFGLDLGFGSSQKKSKKKKKTKKQTSETFNPFEW